MTEWTTKEFDLGTQRATAYRHTLPCGHVLLHAAAYPSPFNGDLLSAASLYQAAEDKAKAVLLPDLHRRINAHDCATYERDQTISKVTARLSRGLPREAHP